MDVDDVDTVRRNAQLLMERHAVLGRARMGTRSGKPNQYAAAEREMNEALEACLRINDKIKIKQLD